MLTCQINVWTYDDLVADPLGCMCSGKCLGMAVWRISLSYLYASILHCTQQQSQVLRNAATGVHAGLRLAVPAQKLLHCTTVAAMPDHTTAITSVGSALYIMVQIYCLFKADLKVHTLAMGNSSPVEFVELSPQCSTYMGAFIARKDVIETAVKNLCCDRSRSHVDNMWATCRGVNIPYNSLACLKLDDGLQSHPVEGVCGGALLHLFPFLPSTVNDSVPLRANMNIGTGSAKWCLQLDGALWLVIFNMGSLQVPEVW
ncbi:hypothetical protein C8Q72DRAFT_799392 [Fomitopsis betulina]|nr:hypothetical protein C8Q72DRAFT_799392 [Fomitopsis betulina]